MAEPTWTTVHIGGALPANLIEAFLDAADYFYDCDGDFDEESIRAAASENRSLMLQGNVNYGNPEVLVAFCRKHGLPFWLHFDSGYEWDAGIQTWRPGDDAVAEHGATDQGNEPEMSLQELRAAAKAGKTLADVIDHMTRFESDWVPAITIAPAIPDEVEGEPIGAIAPDGTRFDHWDERLRSAGCTPVYAGDAS